MGWVLVVSFRNNEVRLQLHTLAYNLGNFVRTLALPKAVEQWSLTTLREKLVKIGVNVVRHGSYITFQLAEVAISRDVFADILSRSEFTKGRLLLHNLTFTRPTRAVKNLSRWRRERDKLMWLTFYGIRGSTASPGPDTLKYGGNTSCVHVELEK